MISIKVFIIKKLVLLLRVLSEIKLRTSLIAELLYSFFDNILMASEACQTTPKFLEKIPAYVIVICRTGSST